MDIHNYSRKCILAHDLEKSNQGEQHTWKRGITGRFCFFFFFTKVDRKNDFIFKQNYFLNFYGTQEQIK